MSERNGLTFIPSADWFWRPDGTHSTEVSGAIVDSPPAVSGASAPGLVTDTREVQTQSAPDSPPASQTLSANSAAYFPADGMPAGVTISEADWPVFDSFAGVLALNGVDPSVGPAIARWYHEFTQRQEAEDRRQLQQLRDSSERTLREVWGADYASNIARASRLIDGNAPDPATADAIFNARMPNGELLGDHVGALRWLLNMDKNGTRNADIAAGYAPHSGTSAADVAELNAIRKLMANTYSVYWRGPDSARLQTRFRELVELLDAAN